MKRTFAVFSIAAALYGLAPIARAADQKLKSAADDTLTIKLDVAMDTSSTRAGRPDWSVTGPLRGDTFVSNGLIYADGSIPAGDTSATLRRGGRAPPRPGRDRAVASGGGRCERG